MQHRSGFLFAVLGAALCVAIDVAGAGAQINPFRRSTDRVDLTPEDLQLMNRAVSSLSSGDTRAGQKAAWENPDSGTSGTIEIVKTFEKQGMPCQKRRYSFRNERKSATDTFVLDMCRLPSGEWKIV
jgi:surface antigen